LSDRTEAITKILSRNDTSETGGHQGGILIPKKPEILSFFPSLKEQELNPRKMITFHDHTGNRWIFSFIHYNNRLFGGTRNEYRLTGMTKCLRYVNATAGDTIKLLRDENGIYWFEHYPANKAKRDAGSPLRLGNTWKVVNIK
jgi:hypothetical protein